MKSIETSTRNAQKLDFLELRNLMNLENATIDTATNITIENIRNAIEIADINGLEEQIQNFISYLLQTDQIHPYFVSSEFIDLIISKINPLNLHIFISLFIVLIYKSDNIQQSECIRILQTILPLIDLQTQNEQNLFWKLLLLCYNIHLTHENILLEIPELITLILESIIPKMQNNLSKSELLTIVYFISIPCLNVDSFDDHVLSMISTIFLLLIRQERKTTNLITHTIKAATLFACNANACNMLIQNSFLSFFIENFPKFPLKLWGYICGFFGACINSNDSIDSFHSFNAVPLIQNLFESTSTEFIVGVLYFLNNIFHMQMDSFELWVKAGLIDYCSFMYPNAVKQVKKQIVVLFVNILQNSPANIIQELFSTPIIEYIIDYMSISKNNLRIEIYDMVLNVLNHLLTNNLSCDAFLESIYPIASEDCNSSIDDISERAQAVLEIYDQVVQS